MKKNIYLGFFGIWLMSPPKQQSAQPSSPEVAPKPSPGTSSQSSSDQGESPDNVDLEKEELRKELAETKQKLNESEKEIWQLYGRLQKATEEQWRLMSQSCELMQVDQQIMLKDLEPETKKKFGIGQAEPKAKMENLKRGI